MKTTTRALIAIACTAALLGCESSGPSAARLTYLGNVSLQDGRPGEALSYYDAALDKRSNEAEAHANRARALLALGRSLEAREAFGVAYDIEPTNETYLDGIIEASIQADRPGEAIERLERLANDSLEPAAYIRLGDLQRDLGLLDEAVVAYRRAAAVSGGSSVEAYRALAGLFREIDDRDRELRQLKYILFLVPTDEAAAARVRELGEVPGPSFRTRPPDQS